MGLRQRSLRIQIIVPCALSLYILYCVIEEMFIPLFSHDQMYLSTADEDELPKILPPKRRRMIKEKVNTSAPTIGMERLMQEFPKHNWLETKYLTDETLSAQAQSMSGQADTTPYQYQYEDAVINGDSTCQSQSDEAQNNGQCTHSNDMIEIQSEKQHDQNEGMGRNMQKACGKVL